jgi:hypothetical protein
VGQPDRDGDRGNGSLGLGRAVEHRHGITEVADADLFNGDLPGIRVVLDIFEPADGYGTTCAGRDDRILRLAAQFAPAGNCVSHEPVLRRMLGNPKQLVRL